MEGQIKLARHPRTLERRDGESFKAQRDITGLVDDHDDVEQWGSREITVEVQFVDELVERVNLVLERAPSGVADATEECAKRFRRIDYRAERQHVDVEADLIAELGTHAAGHR